MSSFASKMQPFALRAEPNAPHGQSMSMEGWGGIANEFARGLPGSSLRRTRQRNDVAARKGYPELPPRFLSK